MDAQNSATNANRSFPQLLLYTLNLTIRNPSLLLIVCWSFAGISWIVIALQGVLNHLLVEMVKQGHVPERFRESLELAHNLIPWVIVLPLIFAVCSFAAPVLLLNNNKAPLLKSLNGLIVSIKFSILGITYTFRVLPYFLVPGIALILLDPIISTYIESDSMQYGYYVVIACISVWTVNLCMPILLVPMLCAINQKLPIGAIQDSYSFHSLNAKMLFGSLMLLVAFIWIANYTAAELNFGVSVHHALLYIFIYIIGASVSIAATYHCAMQAYGTTQRYP